jgi:RNA polymerase sigma-70 factor (subfamily 1)
MATHAGPRRSLPEYQDYLCLLARLQLQPLLQGRVDPSDIVQDTLRWAQHHHDRFTGQTEAEYEAWLRQILLHQLIEATRRWHRAGRELLPERSLEEALQKSAARLESWLAGESPSPGRQEARQENVMRLARALGQLPEDQRTALEMKYLQGFSLETVSRYLGAARPAVAHLLHRGAVRMWERMRQRGTDSPPRADEEVRTCLHSLDEVVADYLDAADRGLMSERRSWLARYPDLAEELAEILAAFDLVEGLAGHLWTATDPTLGRATLRPEGWTPNPTSPAAIEATPAGGTRSFGDFEILGVLGTGGMGVIYRARQRSLNRVVALKMIRSGTWATEGEALRFRNEAEAAASLDHPHIVAVYEVGRAEGQLYYAMRLVEGRSLAEDLSRFRSQPRRAARLMATVARAVHHAHQRGLLHRDLKPSNILIDHDGQPHVTDFGLAKRVEGGPSLTLTGAMVGTPGYMAPEQTGGVQGPVTAACDVYSLGAVLYALLAGRSPFRGDNVLEVVEQTRNREPAPLSDEHSRADRDLETICRKCLEKDPRRRYPSAEALAEDLERWLEGKPIEARRPTRARRLWLWSRRHPSLAGLSAAVGLLVPLLITTLAIAVLVVGRQRDEARATQEQLRQNLYAADMGLAYRAWLQGDMTQLSQLLDHWQPQPQTTDVRDFAWHFLDSLRRSDTQKPPSTDRAHRGSIYGLRYSPDGRTLASAGKDGTVRLQMAGRAPLFLRGHTDEVNWVTFDRQGRRLATASDDGTARVWDAATGRQLVQVNVPGKEVVAAEFTADGQTLLTAGHDGHLRLWRLPSGAPVRDIPLAQGAPELPRIEALAVAPDGRHVAAVLHYGSFQVRDLESGLLCYQRSYSSAVPCCVEYSPSGQSLAVGDRWGNVRVFHAASGEQQAFFPSEHGSTAEGVAFAPDGQTLASCGLHGRVRLWDLRTGLPRGKLDTEDLRIWSVTFSPDGRSLLAGGDDGVIRKWDVSPTQVPQYLPAAAGDALSLAFTIDGSTLAASTSQGVVSFWDPQLRRERPGLDRLHFEPQAHHPVSFGAGGTVLGVLTPAGSVQLWEPQGRRLIGRRDLPQPSGEGNAGMGLSLCCRPGSLEWTICREKRPLLRWDSAGGQDLPTGVGDEPCALAAWSPDGTILAAYQLPSKQVRLLHTRTGETTILAAAESTSVAFSPDGAVLATGRADGQIRLWDTATGQLRGELVGHRMPVHSLTFSPDGKVLASGGEDGTVRLWHLASGREHFTLPARPGGSVRMLAFAPDGHLLAAAYTGSREGDGVALWRAAPP